MKKITALVLAMMICLSTALALAEEQEYIHLDPKPEGSITMKEASINNLLFFMWPSEWSWMELSESVAQRGCIALGTDSRQEMGICLKVHRMDTATEPEELREKLLEADNGISSIEMRKNNFDETVLSFQSDDGEILGCFILIDEKTAVSIEYTYFYSDKYIDENDLLRAYWNITIDNLRIVDEQPE